MLPLNRLPKDFVPRSSGGFAQSRTTVCAQEQLEKLQADPQEDGAKDLKRRAEVLAQDAKRLCTSAEVSSTAATDGTTPSGSYLIFNTSRVSSGMQLFVPLLTIPLPL